MKTLIEVEIFGHTFTVTSEDERTYVQELANFVDQRMRRLGESTKAINPVRVAIMAALDIADEYLKAQKNTSEEKETVEQISAQLLARLEQSEKLDRSKVNEIADTAPLRMSSSRSM